MGDILHMSALELGQNIKSGALSAVEATRAALAVIDSGKDTRNTFTALCPETALARAEYVQAHLDAFPSPLAGVPMALKDNICTQGLETGCASRMLAGYVPPYSATVWTRLEQAGCILLGKLNMDEFAMGSTTESSCHGPTRNPWDPAHVPGGSSGGAAAAVAAGECFFALGSDTGGSVRQPAAHCGVTGLKPTYGAVSRYGLIAYASSLEQIGPIARCVADCGAVLDLIAGKDPLDSTSLTQSYSHSLQSFSGDLRGLRIGLPEEYFGPELEPSVAKAVLAAGDVLARRGAQIKRFSFPLLRHALPAYYILACAEASSNLARYDGVKYGFRAADCNNLDALYIKTRSQGFGPEVQRRILLGTFVLSAGYYDAYYRKALTVKSALKAAFAAVFQRYDLLLGPVSPTTAPKLGESLSDPLGMYRGDIYTVSANLAGVPALSMPCGFDRAGLPIGAQLIAPAFGEAQLLNAAHAFQQDTAFHQMRPKGGSQ